MLLTPCGVYGSLLREHFEVCSLGQAWEWKDAASKPALILTSRVRGGGGRASRCASVLPKCSKRSQSCEQLQDPRAANEGSSPVAWAWLSAAARWLPRSSSEEMFHFVIKDKLKAVQG